MYTLTEPLPPKLPALLPIRPFVLKIAPLLGTPVRLKIDESRQSLSICQRPTIPVLLTLMVCILTGFSSWPVESKDL